MKLTLIACLVLCVGCTVNHVRTPLRPESKSTVSPCERRNALDEEYVKLLTDTVAVMNDCQRQDPEMYNSLQCEERKADVQIRIQELKAKYDAEEQ